MRDDNYTPEEIDALAWRNITQGDECSRCAGSGKRTYPSTATWKGGIGGQALTDDVCDNCWGSGEEDRPWPSHRNIIGGKPVAWRNPDRGDVISDAYKERIVRERGVDGAGSVKAYWEPLVPKPKLEDK